MTDKKISELTEITGANTAADDYFVIVDTSADETKKISRDELNNAIEQDALSNVTITGGTIDGTIIGDTTPAAGNFTSGSFTGDLSFGDGNKAVFGAGSDLRIYHDGFHSYIYDTGAGDLRIRGVNLQLQTDAGENYLSASNNGAVTLYHDNASKLATTATGIDVTGTVTADGLTLANNTYVRQNDAAAGLPRILGINSGNVTYVGPIDPYAGGSVFYGASANVTSHNFFTAADERLRIASNGDISFYEDTGTTPKFFWDASAERLGLGTDSPQTLLDISDARSGTRPTLGAGTKFILESSANPSAFVAATILGGATSGASILNLGDVNDEDVGQVSYHHSDNSMRFKANASERMRIDSSGRLQVGTTSAINDGAISALGSGRQAITAKVTNDANSIFQGFNSSGTAVIQAIGNGNLYLKAPTGNHTLQLEASVGASAISFLTGNGTVNTKIRSGLGGSANLLFETDGSERMRIDSSGNLLVGTTTDGGVNGLTLKKYTTGVSQISNVSFGGGFAQHTFRYNGTTVGSILTYTNATAYNTSSDYRLKEDFQSMTGVTERVKALNPVNFAWKSDGSRVDGFIAHEAQTVVPEAVTGEKDAMRDEEYEVTPAVYEDVVIPAVLDDDGNEIEAERTEQQLVTEAVMGTRSVPDYQGIDQAKLVPLLTAALQEAITKIEDLEARVATLEGN